MGCMMLFASGCGHDDDGDDSSKQKAKESEAALNKAIYCLKYAIKVSSDYNDKKLSTSSISGIASVKYTASTLLDYMEFFPNSLLTTTTFVRFHTDVGRRPASICESSLTPAVSLRNGTYDYEGDPSKVIACFGNYSGNRFLGSLGFDLNKLKLIANNDDITQTVFSNIYFAQNSYKMIVFGKNKAGKLVGKYIGSTTYNGPLVTFNYWCIDPEDASYGKNDSVDLN
jgi:hypothetical protein